jgi:hypothetical protein
MDGGLIFSKLLSQIWAPKIRRAPAFFDLRIVALLLRNPLEKRQRTLEQLLPQRVEIGVLELWVVCNRAQVLLDRLVGEGEVGKG